ncbi:MAG: exo-alpha-sialidase, partial [Myxococcales bacterium]|nr:exo-alpha-sialidase [Myxococcales bacterium]
MSRARSSLLFPLLTVALLTACPGGSGSEVGSDDEVSTSDSEGTGSDSSDTGTGDTTGDGTDTTGEEMALEALRWTFEGERLGGAVSDGPVSEGGVVEGTLAWIPGQRRETIAARGGEGMIVLDPAKLDFAADDDFRVEARFRTGAHGRSGEAGRGPLAGRGDAAQGWALAVVDGHLRFSIWSGGESAVLTSPALVADDRFHQVTAMRDAAAGTLALVIDGHDVATGSDVAGALDTTAPLLLLGAADGARLHGFVDEIAVVPGPLPTLPTATPEWDDRPVFTAGVDQVQGFGYAAFRIPSVVTLGDGTLLAFAEGRVDQECDFGRIHVVMKRSDDGGDSWGPLRLVATEPITNGSGKAGNPIPVADGDRVALMVLETPCESGSACSCSGEQHFALYRSDDRGDSWTAREEITADVTQAGWGGVLLGPGSGFVMRGGSNPGRLVIPAKHGGSSHLLISDDHGESWSVGASGDSPLAVNESTAAELSDGRILINARYQRSLDQQIQEQGLGFRLVGHVAGDGDWSYADDPTFFRESLFPGPVVHAALLSRSKGALFGEEARILFSYPAGEFGTSAGRRRDLRIYVSRDDGESWARTHRAIGNSAAYSDLTNLGDGRGGMLYEGGHELGPSLDAYRRVHFMRFRPEWLDHAALATYGFEELAVDATPTQLAGAGGFPLDLAVQGTLTAVAGRHDSSTALRFD